MSKCESLYARATKTVPGGVHSNSRARSPYPQFFSKGEGAILTYVDGQNYVDLIFGHGALFFCHGYQPFAAQYQQPLTRCTGLTPVFHTYLAVVAA